MPRCWLAILVVLAQTPRKIQPAKGPLHDPAPLEPHEARVAGRAGDDLQYPTSGAAYPADQAAPIRTVCSDPSESWHPTSALLEDQPTTGPILHTRGMHQQPVD